MSAPGSDSSLSSGPGLVDARGGAVFASLRSESGVGGSGVEVPVGAGLGDCVGQSEAGVGTVRVDAAKDSGSGSKAGSELRSGSASVPASGTGIASGAEFGTKPRSESGSESGTQSGTELGQTGPQILGARLTAARRKSGLTVESLSASTRIRGQLIRQIEAGDLTRCGGDVYARGHIRALAKVIGIDPEPLISEYLRTPSPVAPTPRAIATPTRGRAQARVIRPAAPASRPAASPVAAEQSAATPPAARAPQPRRKQKAGVVGDPKGANWTAAMLVVLLGIVVFAGMQLFGGHDGKSGAVAAHTPIPTPAAASPSRAPVRAAAPAPVGVAFRISAVDASSWLSVMSSDGRTLYDNMLAAGAVQTFQDGHELAVTVGNAAAVHLQVNGKDFGTAGGDGQVVHLTVNPGGVVAG